MSSKSTIAAMLLINGIKVIDILYFLNRKEVSSIALSFNATNFLPFFPFLIGLSLRGENLLFYEQILTLNSGPFLEKLRQSEMQKESLLFFFFVFFFLFVCLFFCKTDEKEGSNQVNITLFLERGRGRLLGLLRYVMLIIILTLHTL